MLTVEHDAADKVKSAHLHRRHHGISSELNSRTATRRKLLHTQCDGSHCLLREGESESKGGSERDLVYGPDVGSLSVWAGYCCTFTKQFVVGWPSAPQLLASLFPHLASSCNFAVFAMLGGEHDVRFLWLRNRCCFRACVTFRGIKCLDWLIDWALNGCRTDWLRFGLDWFRWREIEVVIHCVAPLRWRWFSSWSKIPSGAWSSQ